MDSLSQAVLGAITFAVVKDKEIGKKALLYGAILGTIPDLDVFLNPFFDDVQKLAVHRAFSHSILFSILLSLLVAKWFSKKHNSSYISWVWASFLALFTHPLLDLCTTYGTRILYPITKSYYSLNNVFVVDLAYTLPLLIAVITLWIMKNSNTKRSKIINISLLLSTGYLLWGLVVREIIYTKYESILKEKNIAFEKMTVVPTPFNTLYWQVIVKSKDGYYFSDYSLLDKNWNKSFIYEKNDISLIQPYINKPELEPLFNFLDGYELVRKESDTTYVYSAKFGPIGFKNNKPQFVFPYIVDKKGNFIESDKTPKRFDKTLEKLWIRIKGK